ncbi:MAG: hypothetical protein PVG49_21460 [Desulfobacteraceae bacterium]
MTSAPAHRLVLKAQAAAFPAFSPLLQEGVNMEVQVGCPIRSLLCDQLGLDPDYVDTRIQTVFLNGKPVDRMEEAVVPDQSVVALSAALPGLLGATLRKSGVFASLRQGITHTESGAQQAPTPGSITLRVFNVLLPELAPRILQAGVRVRAERLEACLRRQGPQGIPGVQGVTLDGKGLEPVELHELHLETGAWIELVVIRTEQIPHPRA